MTNPLLTEPDVHQDLKPLCDAVVMVVVWSDVIARCYADMLAEKESRGMPGPDEWPDSPALERSRAQHAQTIEATREEYAATGESVAVADFLEPRWTRLMREWSGYYRDWCAAIATAKERARSPAVAAIMDAGEARPVHRWTTQVTIDLDRLAGTMHPIGMGGDDGLGFVRCGLPPLPEDFRACVEAVRNRIVELRSIPAPAVPPTPKRNVRLARTRAAYLEAHGNVSVALEALKEAGYPVARSTFYNHLNALDMEIPGWRDSVQRLCAVPHARYHGRHIRTPTGESRRRTQPHTEHIHMWWIWARCSSREFDTPGHVYPPLLERGYKDCFARGIWGDDPPLDDLIRVGLESSQFAGVIFAWPALRDAPFPVRSDVFDRPVPIEMYGPDVPDVLIRAGMAEAIASRTEVLRRARRQCVLYCGMPVPRHYSGACTWPKYLEEMGWPSVWLDSAGAVTAARTWFRALARANYIYDSPGLCGVEPIPEVHGHLSRLVSDARIVAVQSGVRSPPQPWPYTPFAPDDARVRLHGPGYYGLACHHVWHRIVLVFPPSDTELARAWHATGSVDVAMWPRDVTQWREMLSA